MNKSTKKQNIIFSKFILTALISLGVILIVLLPLAILVAYMPQQNEINSNLRINNTLLSLLSTGIMLVFATSVLNKYLASKKPQFFYWGTGLLMFGIVSLAEIFLSITWNKWMFFFWYFFGAVINAAWIGQGTVHLLLPKKWTFPTSVALILCSLIALILMLDAMPLIDSEKFNNSISISEQYQMIMPDPKNGGVIRLITPIFNIYGAATLIGGAIWSSYLFWRKKVLPNRVIGNILIALGAIIVSIASILTRIGLGEWWYIGELLAATLLFSGFILTSRQPFPKHSYTTKIPTNIFN